jgi:cobalt-zinc-cadmium resistance protein CzcA
MVMNIKLKIIKIMKTKFQGITIRFFSLFVVIVFGIKTIEAQKEVVNFDQAFEIAVHNYAGIEFEKLNVQQREVLAQSGIPQHTAQIYISGEEFDFENQSGVHSLNINQNFVLPKTSNAYRQLHENEVVLAQKGLGLTSSELKRQVGKAYYQLLFAKLDQALVDDGLDLYNNFLLLTSTQLESGETGKMPQLAARSRHGQALLEAEHAEEQYGIALSLFNQWMGSDSNYIVEGDFTIAQNDANESLGDSNPHLEMAIAKRDVAIAQVEVAKAKLYPSINSGFKLQTVAGIFPLFGYQFGVDVPLFKKSYKHKIDAAKIGILVHEASIKKERQDLQRIIGELEYRLEHQHHIVEFLDNELSPIVNEQSALNLKAYKAGEIGYLEFLDGLEQVLKVKRQHLRALYELNVLRVELDFWTGN